MRKSTGGKASERQLAAKSAGKPLRMEERSEGSQVQVSWAQAVDGLGRVGQLGQLTRATWVGSVSVG